MVDEPLQRKEFLSFAPPWIGEEEIDEVVSTLRSGWLTTGPRTKRFESEFAAYVGAPAALALNSGTAAMHVALSALGVGPGDAVVTTPLTFVSGVHVIEQVGAHPLLADVDPETLNLDPAQADKVIQGAQTDGLRVSTIMPVHLYGHPCELDEIYRLADAHKLDVVEDAAHALPTTHEGRRIGSVSSNDARRVLTAFSFYATKTLTTGEGGMLSGPADLIERARVWALHGIDRDAWNRYADDGAVDYDVVEAGFKYNMSDIQAALGLQQLARLDEARARRAKVALRYNEAFAEVHELETPPERTNVEHAWHIYALRLHLGTLAITRDQFIAELRTRNIGASVHFIPVHLFSYYRERYGFSPQDFPVAFHESQRLVSLPIYPQMTDQDSDDVVGAVCDVVRRHRR